MPPTNSHKYDHSSNLVETFKARALETLSIKEAFRGHGCLLGDYNLVGALIKNLWLHKLKALTWGQVVKYLLHMSYFQKFPFDTAKKA